jgi:hypothetical protein
MAQTIGLVQRMAIVSETVTCVWIGPTPNNTEALVVTNDGTSHDSAFANTLIQILAAAATNYRQVVGIHGNSDAKITAVRIEPI